MRQVRICAVYSTWVSEAEKRLRESEQLVELPDYDFYLEVWATDGKVKRQTNHSAVFGYANGGKLLVQLRVPGEMVIRIDGTDEDIVFILELLGIPSAEFKKKSEEK